jgi:FkbM family methyltransferase
MQSENTFVYDLRKFKMVLDKTDRDGSEQIMNSGWYKDEVVTADIFEKYLKSGMIVLDLGANIGFYTLLASSLVGPKGKVFAFEPSPYNTNLIRASVKENSFTNIVIVEAAVFDHVGKATLYLSPDYISEHSLFDYNYSSGPHASVKKIEVKTTTIDHYLENNVGSLKADFIKMDIEGSESRALEGMKKVLEFNKHLIIVTEFWFNGFKHDKRNPRNFLENLQKLNFKIHHIDEFEQRVYPVSIDEMIEIAESKVKNHIEKNKEDWYTNLLCIR